jgi:hypothetical protein
MSLFTAIQPGKDAWFVQRDDQNEFAGEFEESATLSTDVSAIDLERGDFSLTVITPTTDDKIKEAVKTALRVSLRDWIEIAQSRKSSAERKFLGRLDYPDIISEEQDALIDYKSIVMRISVELGVANNYFMVLTDQDQRIQAVAAFSILPEEIYINALLSAAWNISMQGENAPEHQILAVKGAGVTLMRQLYELAKQQQKSRVSLYSTRSAERFYDEKLKMKTDKKQSYYYDVSQTNLPEALQSSKNLLR